MRNEYGRWLKMRGYAENTCVAQIHRVQRVEQYYGSMDQILSDGHFAEVIAELTYTTEDERRDRPNPSRIEFNGNNRNNLASYKNAGQRYANFWTEMNSDSNAEVMPPVDDDTTIARPADPDSSAPERQRLALERDMQNALRRDITALQPDLRIVDGGAEHRASSGNIDILCEDEAGMLVVVELKAGVTDPRVMSQILGYVGDIMEEQPDRGVRGIIVAHEFDRRTRAAIRAASNIQLVTYEVSFIFNPEV